MARFDCTVRLLQPAIRRHKKVLGVLASGEDCSIEFEAPSPDAFAVDDRITVTVEKAGTEPMTGTRTVFGRGKK